MAELQKGGNRFGKRKQNSLRIQKNRIFDIENVNKIPQGIQKTRTIFEFENVNKIPNDVRRSRQILKLVATGSTKVERCKIFIKKS